MPPAKSSTEGWQAALTAAKMQALYNFAYGLSHEINNPLANIATRAQTLLADEPDAERRRKLATIVQQAFRGHEMIADLMLFVRPPALELQRTDLAALAKKVVSELQPRASEQQTTLKCTGAKKLFATMDAVQIAVALKAIVQNALEAVPNGGQIEVRVELESRLHKDSAKSNGRPTPTAARPRSAAKSASDHRACLSITDNGPGIPAEMMPQIFDPFFCGREAGRGLGLGLSKVWRIVELHGGQIDAISVPGYTQFAVFLPSAPAGLASKK